jgi:hypothetical protein
MNRWTGIAAIALGATCAASAGRVDTQSFSVGVSGGYYGPGTDTAGLIESVYGQSSGWLGWNYSSSYQTFQGNPEDLSEVTVTVQVLLDGSAGPVTFGSRISFFTGWNPWSSQFAEQLRDLTTDVYGIWSQTWRFTGAAARAWAQPPYGPMGYFYGEVFRSDGNFSGTVNAQLTFVTVPAPGALAAASLAGLGARRRHRSR